VRVAVRVARLAARRLYCWLTGTPVGTTADGHVVATHWGLDFDTVNYISRDCPPELLTLHGDRLHWMSTSLEFMARLATVVLALCLKAAVSWLLVAYDTFKAVREMLHDEAFRGLFSDDLLERGVI
jgi:hypothetical protein